MPSNTSSSKLTVILKQIITTTDINPRDTNPLSNVLKSCR